LENREPLKPKIKRKNGAGKEHRTPTTSERTTTSFADITTGQKPSPAQALLMEQRKRRREEHHTTTTPTRPHHHHINPTAPPLHPKRTTTTTKT
jgi:hypothetical protein